MEFLPERGVDILGFRSFFDGDLVQSLYILDLHRQTLIFGDEVGGLFAREGSGQYSKCNGTSRSWDFNEPSLGDSDMWTLLTADFGRFDRHSQGRQNPHHRAGQSAWQRPGPGRPLWETFFGEFPSRLPVVRATDGDEQVLWEKSESFPGVCRWWHSRRPTIVSIQTTFG